MTSPRRVYPAELHKYSLNPTLLAAVHLPPTSSTSSSDPAPIRNYLLFIGGLGDGLLTTQYAATLASRLPPEWGLAELQLSSSYTGWGISSVQQDANEIERCVGYFRGLVAERGGGESGGSAETRGMRAADGKIVLMGHSTGCQDVMQYLISPSPERRSGDDDDDDDDDDNDDDDNAAGARYEHEQKQQRPRPPIQGAILQAAVSDREAMLVVLPQHDYDAAVDLASSYAAANKGNELLPRDTARAFLDGTPCTASRFLSLALAPHDHRQAAGAGSEDFFSSDLDDAQLRATFGAIPPATPLCVLMSGADQHVPSSVDKEALLRRWVAVVEERGGTVDAGVVQGASHSLKGDSGAVLEDLVRRVVGFLERVG